MPDSAPRGVAGREVRAGRAWARKWRGSLWLEGTPLTCCRPRVRAKDRHRCQPTSPSLHPRSCAWRWPAASARRATCCSACTTAPRPPLTLSRWGRRGGRELALPAARIGAALVLWGLCMGCAGHPSQRPAECDRGANSAWLPLGPAALRPQVMACPGGCIGGGGQPKSDDPLVLLKRMGAGEGGAGAAAAGGGGQGRAPGGCLAGPVCPGTWPAVAARSPLHLCCPRPDPARPPPPPPPAPLSLLDRRALRAAQEPREPVGAGAVQGGRAVRARREGGWLGRAGRWLRHRRDLHWQQC